MSKVNKSVQEKLADLSELVEWFQSPSFKLEEAVTKFKEAEKLAETIEQELTELKNEISIVQKRFDVED